MLLPAKLRRRCKIDQNTRCGSRVEQSRQSRPRIGQPLRGKFDSRSEKLRKSAPLERRYDESQRACVRCTLQSQIICVENGR